MKEIIVLKGTREGVAVLADPRVDFSVLVQELGRKLASGAQFWGGAQLLMGEMARNASPEEKRMLQEQLEEFGVIITGTKQAKDQQRPSEETEKLSQNATLIKGTVRSGQRVEVPGSAVILGDVNPGAEVVAGGDIVVLGSLRGVAHAGAKGDTEAVVMAFRLQPTQLRIAHYISRAPDENVVPPGPEIARIKNERITVEQFGG